MHVKTAIRVIFVLSVPYFSVFSKEDTCKGQYCSIYEKPVNNTSVPAVEYPNGDPRNCLRGDYKNLLRLEVLPGTGWDNLRNLNMGMVTLKNYSKCLMSEDGKYLIPNGIFVVPLKESNVELNSEYFDHWNNYSCMTSKSFNVGGNGLLYGFSLGGKFSSEFESVKKHQVEDKAVTTRVQLRYKFYTVHAQSNMQFHPDFKSRLLSIAANLQCNNTAVAKYMADLVVRDYGTHVVTSIDAGAILAKVDQIKKKYVLNSHMDKSTITASASASFFGVFSLGTSYSQTSTQKEIDSYTKSTTHSKIQTHGGTPYRANFSVNKWEDGLLNNLVAIDRSGDPLHFVITTQTLPELPQKLSMQLRELILKAIQRYLKHNTIKGCMDPNSPNFNFQANLEDHSCKAPYTNFTFGGVYQTCVVSGSPSANPCPELQQKNPKVNNYACPDGYQAILLHEGRTPTTCYEKCHRSWLFFKHCTTYCGYAHYLTYWCAASGRIKDHSGYLFGGLYSKLSANPITGEQSCPLKFYPQRFGPEGMFVCISDDYELASRYSLPFAGFFSCSAGNPLVLRKDYGISTASGLENHLYNAGSSSWPKRCPKGYSQHLAIIDEDCEINYCVKANALSDQGLAAIKRPPFSPIPKRNYNITVPLTIINDDSGKIWMKDPYSLNWILVTKEVVIKYLAEHDTTKGAIDNLKRAMSEEQHTINHSSAQTKSSSSSMAPGTAVGITLGVIVFIAVAVAVVMHLRKRRHSNITDRNPLSPSSAHYQALDNSIQQ